ncbi:MarR family winged helix-turn-helix transcriptional regulator [Adlercreutzia sp. ZJ141]|uniref:MarR family winged helix-turn-helix transcriptional regulator n=1 Tax=Adlercreutzia sp. ZJ141 TaxID=2709406 RepID=UPI001F1509B1|nr:MarR family transcriptional regulator [Adlercreutzia sp. ZJ141]
MEQTTSVATKKESEAYQRRAELNDLLTGTFNSILRIEERVLNNRITQGLSITDVHTIAAVGLHEENPMSVVAARLGVTLATLTTAVNRLEREGFVQRVRAEDDRRKVLLSLTAEGRKVHRVHSLFHQHMVDDALLGLTDQEERVLATALSKVKRYFDES